MLTRAAAFAATCCITAAVITGALAYAAVIALDHAITTMVNPPEEA